MSLTCLSGPIIAAWASAQLDSQGGRVACQFEKWPASVFPGASGPVVVLAVVFQVAPLAHRLEVFVSVIA